MNRQMYGEDNAAAIRAEAEALKVLDDAKKARESVRDAQKLFINIPIGGEVWGDDEN